MVYLKVAYNMEIVRKAKSCQYLCPRADRTQVDLEIDSQLHLPHKVYS